MKEEKRQLIKDFNLKQLGYDFMGYEFNKLSQLSFHHLVIARRDSEKFGLGSGYQYWNGVILRQNTSHAYLHLIESIDYDMFLYLTSELIDIKAQGIILRENLIRINECLELFEREHCADKNKNGYLIKEEYTLRRIKKGDL